MVSPGLGLKTGGNGFPGLGLKTSSYGLVIWVSKSPRRFLGLTLKTKRATICWLHHKTGRRMKMTWGTRRDLAACFTWKQVGLEFPSLPQNWWRRDGGWCTWHHHGGCVEMKLKTDGSMGYIGSCYPYFVVFIVLGHMDILVFCLSFT
jgi:hypothetical protein